MKALLTLLLAPLVCLAAPKKLTTVIDDQNAQVTGAYGEGTDCYSKQQALQLQLKVCLDHQTLTSCLDQFYPNFRKKFPKCAEEAAATCLDACAKSMTYSFCSNYCK